MYARLICQYLYCPKKCMFMHFIWLNCYRPIIDENVWRSKQKSLLRRRKTSVGIRRELLTLFNARVYCQEMRFGNWSSLFRCWILLVLDPLHPNLSRHILHTVFYTFLKVQTKRICLTIKSLLSWWSFPLFSWP